MTRRTLVVAALLAALPALASAQSSPPVDPRWAPWLGCWDIRAENVTEGHIDPVVAAARQALPSTRNRGVRICVTAVDTPAAVRQQTIVDDETIFEEIVVADGSTLAVQDQSCRGTRSAEWSSTGRQLFSRGTLACEGQPSRTISGITMMVPGPTWVDIQLVEVGGRRSVRVRRYGVSRDQVLAGGRSPVNPNSPAPVDRLALEEVKEASRKVEPEVVEAALVEVGQKLPLNRDRLLDLHKAGVPGSIVDVMVALSFPEKFIIESGTSGGYGGSGGGFLDPWAVASPMGWLSAYAPFGYQYYGYYDPTWGPGWGWIAVNPDPTPTGPEGRAVNGRGYTRITPREPLPSPRVNGADGGIVDRTGGSNGGSSGSGSGGGVSSGGYSSGGGGGGGRTAQPRPPGGGGQSL